MEAQIVVLSTYSAGIPLNYELHFSCLEPIPRNTGERIVICFNGLAD